MTTNGSPHDSPVSPDAVRRGPEDPQDASRERADHQEVTPSRIRGLRVRVGRDPQRLREIGMAIAIIGALVIALLVLEAIAPDGAW